MRGFAVDERDSTWERDDTRYRVYIFDGPDSATTTIDIVDATIEQALESGVALSDGNAKLWSLALVENDARGMRGLIWLSGMDDNDSPESARDWQRRRHMQDRYLLARRQQNLPVVLPNGLRVIRVSPEWMTAWPLWENFTDKYLRTGPELGVSEALGAELRAWNAAWNSRDEDDPLPAGWEAAGRALVTWLQAELRGIAEVRPEFFTDSGDAAQQG